MLAGAEYVNLVNTVLNMTFTQHFVTTISKAQCTIKYYHYSPPTGGALLWCLPPGTADGPHIQRWKYASAGANISELGATWVHFTLAMANIYM